MLWDCVGLLHPDAVQHIKQQYGGITAIAISHPHFYCAMADWAEAFDCQVSGRCSKFESMCTVKDGKG